MPKRYEIQNHSRSEGFNIMIPMNWRFCQHEFIPAGGKKIVELADGADINGPLSAVPAMVAKGLISVTELAPVVTPPTPAAVPPLLPPSPGSLDPKTDPVPSPETVPAKIVERQKGRRGDQ